MVIVMRRSLVRSVREGQAPGRDFESRSSQRRHRYTRRMASFELRMATPEDVPGICELIEASVRVLQAKDYSPAQIEGALATVFTVDSRLIMDETYFVALTKDGELAGCGGWSFRKTLYGGDHQIEEIVAEKLNPDVDSAKIRAIFVNPKFARKGLGSLILDGRRECCYRDGFPEVRDGEHADRSAVVLG